MSVPLWSLIDNVLTLLHESADSPVAELDDLTTGSVVLTTAQGITAYLNRACADVARNAYPVTGTASLTAQTAQMYPYSQVPTADGGTMYYARSVAWNGQVLTWLTRQAFERWFWTWETDAPGTPSYVFRNGTEGFGVYPAPASAGTLIASGYEIPPPLANPSDTLSAWMPDDLTWMPVYYAANMVALQNDEDMSLKSRAVTWSSAYEAEVIERQKQFWVSDVATARALWASPSVPPAPTPQQQP